VRRILNLAPMALVLGCVTLPVAATVVTRPGRRVTADLLIDDLVQQCDGADLTGVTIGTEVGWVIIGNQERIIATGYCVEPE